jgi:two-component system, NtrC family, response regulator AtoC
MKDLLIVDDDLATSAGLADVVESWGYTPAMAGSLASARMEIGKRVPDLVILDLQLPDGSGIELLEELKSDVPDLPVVMLTGHATIDTAVEALKKGAEDFATKPVDLVRLKVTIETVGEKADLRREVLELRRELQKLGAMGKLVGKSAAMQEIYREIELVARTDASVLVVGESGTGKEIVARTIHALSKRKKKPFVAFNCGAISAALIESEIFGHEKGAFTSAEKKRIGYFETADGGTVFLDEITEMPLELQVKLLRVLEEARFRRVGGNDEIALDARIVAATNRDPERAIKDGRLREDLYYRLNVFPLEIPPLRDRKDDIPLLVAHFVDSFAKAEGSEPVSVHATFLSALRAWDWPGNVRELRNVIQRAFIVSKGADLDASTLPPQLRRLAAAPGPAPEATTNASAKKAPKAPKKRASAKREGGR